MKEGEVTKVTESEARRSYIKREKSQVKALRGRFFFLALPYYFDLV